MECRAFRINFYMKFQASSFASLNEIALLLKNLLMQRFLRRKCPRMLNVPATGRIIKTSDITSSKVTFPAAIYHHL